MALRVDEGGCTRLSRLPKQGSHMLSNLMQAGALAWVPAGAGDVPAGSAVPFLSLLHQ